uniref:Uncharacterized protein n=1 Tax=Corvus moneduloides TaxID=1196302 RepID=A0A8C3E6Z9_CORMO
MIILYFPIVCLLPRNGSHSFKLGPEEGEEKPGKIFSAVCVQGYTYVQNYLFTGILISTTLDKSTTVQYSNVLHQLPMKTRSTVKGTDPQNDLTCLRITSKKHDIMVTPVNISVSITVELYVL